MEKRFPPSPRRLEEARRRGHVAVSPALVGAAALAGAVAGLLASAGAAWDRLISLSKRAFTAQEAPEALLAEAWRALGWTLGPALGAAFAAALVAGLVQTRGLLAVGALVPVQGARPPRERRVGAGRALAFALVAGAA